MIKTQNKMWVEFGHGDVLVGSMLFENGVGALTFDNSLEPHEIGALIPDSEAEEKNPYESPIIMTFDNIKSLDVVIHHLNRIRSAMEAFENSDFEEGNDGLSAQ